ncbi:hypothetical protein HPB47_000541 [Ixodes persulcatus]|uniref:Uncharacterized protein n=1 Tax=Ixodes persulcatus TaxID=34615 RepID=A0AC60PRG3_IXOPE|nr:hypothetical protein HPB47_000541 [Ixodes persulcatus]
MDQVGTPSERGPGPGLGSNTYNVVVSLAHLFDGDLGGMICRSPSRTRASRRNVAIIVTAAVDTSKTTLVLAATSSRRPDESTLK